jgi:tetratricopeptide (TPR) repeat protein
VRLRLEPAPPCGWRIVELARAAPIVVGLLCPHPANALVPTAATASSPYELVLQRYAEGDRSGASRLLADLDPRRVPGEARDYAGRLRLLSDDHRRVCLLKAAVLLHTDAAIARRAAGDPIGTDGQLDLALLYAGLADSFPRDASLQSFARQWYLAAALDRHRYLEAEGAAAILQDGLRRFPADPEMLLALGSVEETLATWPVLLDPPVGRTAGRSAAAVSVGESAGVVVREGPGRHDVKERLRENEHLREAEKDYRAALAADGGLVEARLRLGRVLLLLGQTAAARAEITQVLGEARDPALRYLGLLFRGRLLEAASEFTEAVRSYREAAALFPEAQAARMALGHALDHLGDLGASRAELGRAVVDGAPLFERPDPWAAYPYGQSRRAESLLATLKGEVSP